MTGLEPAGGCTTLKNSINAKAVATAAAMAHQCAPKALRNNKPLIELTKCPAITLRGCENATSGKPNTSTQVAPNEPSTRLTARASDIVAVKAMARKAPSQAKATDLNAGRGGHPALSLFSFFSNDKIIPFQNRISQQSMIKICA